MKFNQMYLQRICNRQVF